MQQTAQVTERAECLNPQHQDNQQGLNRHDTVRDAIGTEAKCGGSPDGYPEIGDTACRGIGGQHPHGRAENFMCLAAEFCALGTALSESLQRCQTLQGIEEL